MSVELAMVAAPAVIMFFYFNAGLKLGDTNQHEGIALFFFLMSFVMSWLLIVVADEIVKDNGTLGNAVENDLGLMYFVVVIVGVIALIYFILRTMIAPMIAANKKKKLKL